MTISMGRLMGDGDGWDTPVDDPMCADVDAENDGEDKGVGVRVGGSGRSLG